MKTLGFKLVAGRDIDIYKYPTDSNAMLLSETAVKQMRLQHPLGQTINGDGQDWIVVGVIKDFITESPFSAGYPMVIFGPKSWFTNVHYRLNPNNSTAANLKTIEAIFKNSIRNIHLSINSSTKILKLNLKKHNLSGRFQCYFQA
ncbi:ABC transporter permease [Sphingobacterium sp. E70]|uniref:ABC transporter permease n=1 Tax=Sphingobacterium sp. E70 TaxID=2853439 RepID=UPI00211C3E8A|nr:ABC transporter permease [Sphingobacterium sp. E70]ULT27402.1 ABC transporter permease [Sphingobacterium sp. E70]